MSIVDDISRIERMGSAKSKTWEKLCASIDELGDFLCRLLIDKDFPKQELPFAWELSAVIGKTNDWRLVKEKNETLTIAKGEKGREAVIAFCEDIARGLLHDTSRKFGKELGGYTNIALSIDAFLGRHNPNISIVVKRSTTSRSGGRYKASLSAKPNVVESGATVAEAVGSLIDSFQKDPERMCK